MTRLGRRRLRPLAVVPWVVVGWALVGCSGDDASPAPADDPAATNAPADDPSAPPTDPSGSGTDPTPGSDAPLDPEAPVVPGVEPIELLTTGDGLGVRPLLQWSAVEGAERYFLAVTTPEGEPWWVWSGTNTEVPFGGGPVDDPDTTGARLTRPLVWFVVAERADGTVLAASTRGDLAP